MSDIIVCYGQDNNGQAYAGGIIYGSIYTGDKPCFLDVVGDHGSSIGVVYIHFHYTEVNYYKHSGSKVLRIIIYGR